MNELSLSNDLQTIELEINHHKNIAGQSIWEIGRRLKHVKENDLAHGEFGQWVESIGIAKTEASRFIKIVDELPKLGTFTNFGTKALYLIATLPEQEKQDQLQKIEQGESPTVRELQDLKRQLKQSQGDLKLSQEKIQKQSDLLVKQQEHIENLRRQPKEFITETIEKEIVPVDYEELKNASIQLEKLQTEHQRLLDERQEANEKSQKFDELNEAIAISQGKLNATQKKIGEYNNLHKLIKESNEFLTHASALAYSDISGIMESDPVARKEIIYLLDNLERFTNDLQQLLSNNLIIEGEIIND